MASNFLENPYELDHVFDIYCSFNFGEQTKFMG